MPEKIARKFSFLKKRHQKCCPNFWHFARILFFRDWPAPPLGKYVCEPYAAIKRATYGSRAIGCRPLPYRYVRNDIWCLFWQP